MSTCKDTYGLQGDSSPGTASGEVKSSCEPYRVSLVLRVAVFFALVACKASAEPAGQGARAVGTGAAKAASLKKENGSPARPARHAGGTSLPRLLLLSYAQFKTEGGKVLPGVARLEILRFVDGSWSVEVLEDPESNVFHKAMGYEKPGAVPGVVTFGGMAAAVKLWRRGAQGFSSQVLWQEDFGGEFSRMRDAEIADVFGRYR